ncbi:MAG: NADH-quinone oxidoreductase subunit [Actinomycetota bacterium]|jgi:NADH-quinone oxidoreductase subunit J
MHELSLLAATKVDSLTFIFGAAIILGGALGVVTARNPVHAALLLVQTLFGVAILFVAQGAHFLAAVQVIVYAGAIVVLFLFVIMLLGVDKEELVAVEPLRNQVPVAIAVMVVTAAEMAVLVHTRWTTGAPSVVGKIEGPGRNVEQIAETIFTRYLFAFEATSVLLVIAVVAAVALARRPEGADVDADYVTEVEALEAEELAAKEAVDASLDEFEAEEEAAEVEESEAEESEAPGDSAEVTS